ncbi:TetR/AcrR family transcriptional regulator (plasmid) [Telmatobacter bradus]|uniref:TetR/AcrR family transcriptional regulator n=1 Tax=Telmatobacter bradus TaxID=474953 RepID=UPI003B43A5E6
MKQHILDTARPIIAGKGFAAVGLNEILSAAGIPKGSFYYYFTSKDQFGRELLDTYFTEYMTRLESMLFGKQGTAASRLMSYWQAWETTQNSQDAEYMCLAVKLGGEVSDLSETMREALRRGTTRIMDLLSGCIEEGLADGSIPVPLNARKAGAQLYALWVGASLLEKIHRDGHLFETALTTTKQLLHLTA